MALTTTPSNTVPAVVQPGKHTGEMNGHTSYAEYRAKQNPARRVLIERDRLAQGLAKHRAHRMLLPDYKPHTGIAA